MRLHLRKKNGTEGNDSDLDNFPLQRLVYCEEQKNMKMSDEQARYQQYIIQCKEQIKLNDRERQIMSKDNITVVPEEELLLQKGKRDTDTFPAVTRGPEELVGGESNKERRETEEKHNECHNNWDDAALKELEHLLSDEDSDDRQELHQISQVGLIQFITITVIYCAWYYESLISH